MEHIKRFNEIKNIRDDISFQEDIKDMTLELQDEGFFVNFSISKMSPQLQSYPDESWIKLQITKSKEGDDYEWEEIKDVVERIKEYSIENGYHCNFTWEIESDEHGVHWAIFLIYGGNYRPISRYGYLAPANKYQNQIHNFSV